MYVYIYIYTFIHLYINMYTNTQKLDPTTVKCLEDHFLLKGPLPCEVPWQRGWAGIYLICSSVYIYIYMHRCNRCVSVDISIYMYLSYMIDITCLIDIIGVIDVLYEYMDRDCERRPQTRPSALRALDVCKLDLGAAGNGHRPLLKAKSSTAGCSATAGNVRVERNWRHLEPLENMAMGQKPVPPVTSESPTEID